jgi:hypothetical protein
LILKIRRETQNLIKRPCVIRSQDIGDLCPILNLDPSRSRILILKEIRPPSTRLPMSLQ